MTSLFSRENRLKIGRTSEFQSLLDFAFDLGSHMVPFLIESKSNEKFGGKIASSYLSFAHNSKHQSRIYA